MENVTEHKAYKKEKKKKNNNIKNYLIINM